METEEVRREQSWYIRDLMAYMLGIPGEDLERLVESYQEDGGAPDPGGLFRYLSARGKKYQILWAAIPFSDAISVLFAAVMGPNKALLWQGSSVVPFGLDSSSLRIWNRVLEMVSGVAIPTNPQVSETDLWSAEQAHRSLRKLWDRWVPRFLGEMDLWFSQQKKTDSLVLEDPELTVRLSLDASREMREATGKGYPLGAVRMALVSLPDLRDMGLEVNSLQAALDSFVAQSLPVTEEGGKEAAEPSAGPGVSGRIVDVRPQVDPLEGVALSELRPGDLLMLDGLGGQGVEGKIYMIRLLKGGQYEVHGHFAGEEEVFFRFVSPGEIRLRLPEEAPRPPRKIPIPLLGVLGLAGLACVILLVWALRNF